MPGRRHDNPHRLSCLRRNHQLSSADGSHLFLSFHSLIWSYHQSRVIDLLPLKANHSFRASSVISNVNSVVEGKHLALPSLQMLLKRSWYLWRHVNMSLRRDFAPWICILDAYLCPKEALRIIAYKREMFTINHALLPKLASLATASTINIFY